ncbi:MAG: hypothetical protein ACE5FS_11510 [Paracoccaceae bacterium]
MKRADRARRRAEAVIEGLRRERHLLRLGKYRQLETARLATGRALDALLPLETDVARQLRDRIDGIRLEAERNRVLLRAAIRGLDEARGQLRLLDAAPAGLRIYTRAGGRVELGATDRNSLRKL